MGDRDDDELRSAALLNATSILLARQRAERELVAANEALQRKSEELARSVARLRATLESTTNAVMVTDADGIITDYNARFTAMWGLADRTIESKGGAGIRALVAPQLTDPEAFLHRLEEISLTSQPETFDTLEFADGRVFERHSRIQLDQGRNIGRVWSFHDITRHRRAAAELREQREWFRVTLSSIGDAVITTDLESKVTFLNPVAEMMTGWSDEQARRVPLEQVFTIIHEETRERVENPIAQVLRDGVTVALANHTALIARDGRETAIEDSAAPIRDAAGKITGAVMVFHDVTGRRRADEALRESETRLRVSLATAALGTWEMDLKSSMVRLDERCQELFGLRGNPVISRKAFFEVAHPDNRDQRREALLAVEQGQRTRVDMEYRIEKGDRWIKASAKPMRDSAGHVVRIMGAVLDITDMMKARATTEERRKELEQLVDERTASLQTAIQQMEEFSYSVSHDLRAPLRSIQVYAETVLEEFGDKLGVEGNEYMQRIANAGRRMDRLTRDVLSYSKISRESAALAPVSLDQTVAETIEQYVPAQWRKGQVTVAGPLLPVLGHEPLLVQAISNLLVNALKFIVPGATPRVHLWTERRDTEVRLWIEDNGIGVRPEHQPRIWGMFERVHPKDKYDGTGIGLSIVRKAVERMGGTVGVESDGKTGSRFWVQLRSG